MINPEDYFEAAITLHGHRCPAMPLGLRVGAAALNKLGAERAKDGQLVALVEIGSGHFATCFADGIQMVTGCTLGKGNIKKLHYGKWGLTLIEKATGRAVRVTPKAEVFVKSTKSDFFVKYRSKGIPASEVPEEISRPMVEHVLNAADEELLTVSEVFSYNWQDPPHCFDKFICEECGEMVVETYGRFHDGRHLCIPCREKATTQPEPQRG
ncbi:MAG TPA: tRNA CCA-pyrophosphorylase [Phycisphaeraceae bacterium]|nr:tRNA CCA-pyrophosphorylase [Phycisphaeraceae bacterium]